MQTGADSSCTSCCYLLREQVAAGAIDNMSTESRQEFFYRFQLISETIFDLETLAAEHAGTRS